MPCRQVQREAAAALEGMTLTDAELAAGAELVAGRIDFDEYRRRLSV